MINLIKGDCLIEMKNIESGSVDSIICDPPYGTTACKWDSVIPFELMWEQLNRIIKPSGAIVLFGSEPFSSALRISNIKNYKQDLLWNKPNATNPMQAKKRHLQKTENIMLFYKKQCTYNPQGLIRIDKITKQGGTGIISDNRKTRKKEYFQEFSNYPNTILNFKRDKQLHPTQKPVALIEYLIKTYTNENETVLDFTMGSGTTGVACKNLNRSFIGIEMDDKYFEIAKKRIEEN
jgi:site-specific DNA-methyltransferase (adenine-specific)